MANYNHEILVNYLRDVYSMELLVHKIQADICSARKDIQREQAVVAKAESTPVPVEGIVSCPQEDVFYLYVGDVSHSLYRSSFSKCLLLVGV